MNEAKLRLEAATKSIAGLRSAFGVFDFPMSGEKPWDPVREALGTEKWNKALRIGRRQEKEAEEDQGDEDDYEPSDGEADRPVPSNIRDLVLARLKAAGPDGTKVAPIKNYIAGQGIEMHDKTVGMTLYRLSKEGFARRDGRMWLFVSPKEETETPGADDAGER
jgi:hypothetical protein